MPVPGIDPCWYCNGTDHFHDKCWTRKPPTCRDHHEARIALYRNWSTEGLPERMPRITPHQRADLIKNETRLWNEMQPKRERKSS